MRFGHYSELKKSYFGWFLNHLAYYQKTYFQNYQNYENQTNRLLVADYVQRRQKYGVRPATKNNSRRCSGDQFLSVSCGNNSVSLSLFCNLLYQPPLKGIGVCKQNIRVGIEIHQLTETPHSTKWWPLMYDTVVKIIEQTQEEKENLRRIIQL